MSRTRQGMVGALLLAAAFAVTSAAAEGSMPAEHPAPANVAEGEGTGHQVAPTPGAGPVVNELVHGASPTSGEPAPHGAAAAHGGGHHAPTFADVNWIYGFVGARDDVEPSLLYRPTSMQPPVLASLLNASLVFFVLIYFGRKPVRAALVARRASLLRGIEEAGAVRAEAERRLVELDDRLAHIDDRLESIRAEVRGAAEEDRKRILEEASERSSRMEKEAHRLVEAELESARTALKHEIVREAVAAARQQLAAALSTTDESRLAEEHLGDIDRALGASGASLSSMGGRA
jgi:F-type H+-transporting ATPase subunit b